MTSNERKNQERKERKEKILSAAIELIEKQGFEDTTMDEIADYSDISKGTLYLYFKDKAELHQSIKKKALAMIHENFHQILHQDITGAEIVRKMALLFLDFILENTTFNRAMMLFEQSNRDKTTSSDISDDCIALEHELFILMVRALQIGKQDKSILSELPPKILAMHLEFHLRGIMQYYTIGKEGMISSIIEEENTTLYKMLDQFIQRQLNAHTEAYPG
ncbi:TetR/AcrR family transcriptional regulator [Rhodohalobacter sp. 8-1]|uniref:TetR/AcrR family transcriptional regulator n=1 Tax=Rhodohalobacter sp. 8-1 TaxID=3131972 RepID=UPI0030ECB5E2